MSYLSLGHILLIQSGILPLRRAKVGSDYRLWELGNQGKAFLGSRRIDWIWNGISIDTGTLDQLETNLLARLQGFALFLQQQINSLARALVVLVGIVVAVVGHGGESGRKWTKG